MCVLYISRAIYSEPVPLGWYQMAAISDQLGGSWPERLCSDWAIAETDDWKDGLEPCPMTKQQAYTDMARYIYPDPDCEPNQPCPMKPRPEPHIECVESVLPTYVLLCFYACLCFWFFVLKLEDSLIT